MKPIWFKPIWFKWYPKDFLTDDTVMAMTSEERGQYITLLCLDMINNGINEANMKGTSVLVQGCFKYRSGKWYNKRVDAERSKQKAQREKSRLGGIASGKSRSERKKSSKGTSIQVQPKPNQTEAEADTYKDLKENIYKRKKPESEFMSNEDCELVFKHWVSQPSLKKHREFTGALRDGLIKGIHGRQIEGYNFEDMRQSITNYNAVLENPLQFYSHKFTIKEFFTRGNGLVQFLTENEPHKQWMVHLSRDQQTAQKNQQEYDKFMKGE